MSQPSRAPLDRQAVMSLLQKWVFARQDANFPGLYNPEYFRGLGEQLRARDANAFQQIGALLNEYLDEVVDLVVRHDKTASRLAVKKLATSAMFLHFDCFERLLKPTPQMVIEAMRCLQAAGRPGAVIKAATDWIQDIGFLNWTAESERLGDSERKVQEEKTQTAAQLNAAALREEAERLAAEQHAIDLERFRQERQREEQRQQERQREEQQRLVEEQRQQEERQRALEVNEQKRAAEEREMNEAAAVRRALSIALGRQEVDEAALDRALFVVNMTAAELKAELDDIPIIDRMVEFEARQRNARWAEQHPNEPMPAELARLYQVEDRLQRQMYVLNRAFNRHRARVEQRRTELAEEFRRFRNEGNMDAANEIRERLIIHNGLAQRQEDAAFEHQQPLTDQRERIQRQIRLLEMPLRFQAYNRDEDEHVSEELARALADRAHEGKEREQKQEREHNVQLLLEESAARANEEKQPESKYGPEDVAVASVENLPHWAFLNRQNLAEDKVALQEDLADITRKIATDADRRKSRWRMQHRDRPMPEELARLYEQYDRLRHQSYVLNKAWTNDQFRSWRATREMVENVRRLRAAGDVAAAAQIEERLAVHQGFRDQLQRQFTEYRFPLDERLANVREQVIRAETESRFRPPQMNDGDFVVQALPDEHVEEVKEASTANLPFLTRYSSEELKEERQQQFQDVERAFRETERLRRDREAMWRTMHPHQDMPPRLVELYAREDRLSRQRFMNNWAFERFRAKYNTRMRQLLDQIASVSESDDLRPRFALEAQLREHQDAFQPTVEQFGLYQQPLERALRINSALIRAEDADEDEDEGDFGDDADIDWAHRRRVAQADIPEPESEEMVPLTPEQLTLFAQISEQVEQGANKRDMMTQPAIQAENLIYTWLEGLLKLEEYDREIENPDRSFEEQEQLDIQMTAVLTALIATYNRLPNSVKRPFVRPYRQRLLQIAEHQQKRAPERSRRAAEDEAKRRVVMEAGPHCSPDSIDYIMNETMNIDDPEVINVLADPRNPNLRFCYMMDQLIRVLDESTKLYQWTYHPDKTRLYNGEMMSIEHGPYATQIYKLPPSNTYVCASGFAAMNSPEIRAETRDFILIPLGTQVIGSEHHTEGAVWDVDVNVYDIVPREWLSIQRLNRNAFAYLTVLTRKGYSIFDAESPALPNHFTFNVALRSPNASVLKSTIELAGFRWTLYRYVLLYLFERQKTLQSYIKFLPQLITMGVVLESTNDAEQFSEYLHMEKDFLDTTGFTTATRWNALWQGMIRLLKEPRIKDLVERAWQAERSQTSHNLATFGMGMYLFYGPNGAELIPYVIPKNQTPPLLHYEN